jgi:5-methylcytosine-specific restriction endonuclease McrA
MAPDPTSAATIFDIARRTSQLPAGELGALARCVNGQRGVDADGIPLNCTLMFVLLSGQSFCLGAAPAPRKHYSNPAITMGSSGKPSRRSSAAPLRPIIMSANKPSRRRAAQLPASSGAKNRTPNWRSNEDPTMSAGAIYLEDMPAQRGDGRQIAKSMTNYFPACLVLNADYTPLSYLPLSLWSWQDTLRAVFRGTASVLSTYTDHVVRSPSVEIELPSVIVLKTYVQQNRKGQQAPAFTRRNLFVRDGFSCQYCRQKFQTHELTYDHVVPRAKQGGTSWTNVVTACKHCNARKGHRLLKNIPDMDLAVEPKVPTWAELQRRARQFPPRHVHEDWSDYV